MHDVKQVNADADFDNRMSEVINQRKDLLNQAEGDSLSIDDLSEIYI